VTHCNVLSQFLYLFKTKPGGPMFQMRHIIQKVNIKVNINTAAKWRH